MKQITIITPPGRPGTMGDIAELLGQNNVNITDCDLTDDSAHGVILLRAEPYDLALRLLSEAGYHAASDSLIVLKIEDAPGALARVATQLKTPGINILSMRFVRRDSGWATVVLTTDNNAAARTLLSDFLFGDNADNED